MREYQHHINKMCSLLHMAAMLPQKFLQKKMQTIVLHWKPDNDTMYMLELLAYGDSSHPTDSPSGELKIAVNKLLKSVNRSAIQ